MDRAPAHHAKATRKWLTEHDLDYLYLPPHSPQFNAIEECWAWIKHHVRRAEPKTHDELYTATQAACDAISEDVVMGVSQARREERALLRADRQGGMKGESRATRCIIPRP